MQILAVIQSSVLLSACADGLGRSAELLEPSMLSLVQIVSIIAYNVDSPAYT